MSLNENLSQEWLILEQCALLLNPGASSTTLSELLSEQTLHWGEIIQQALRHNMLPLLAYVIQRNDLTKKVPHEFRDLLSVALSMNRHELTIGYREIARIVEAFEQQSIVFAVTKGYTFDSTLYNSAKVRKVNDIDLLVLPADKKKVFAALKDLGYKAGYFDDRSKSIVDMPEATMKLYAMVAEFAPEFVIKIPDPLVQSMCVDMTCSLTWFNSSFKIATSDALEERIWLAIPGHEGVKMPCLNLEYQIIYTALHLFKEAWVEMYGIKDGNDVSLSRFMDILYLITCNKESIKTSHLQAIMAKNTLTLPILWVFKHTERVFELNLCEEPGFAEPVPESWLASWQTERFQTCYWKGTMRERLQRKNREDLFLRNI